MKRELPSKCEVLGAVMAFGLIGFWFGIGAILAVKMVSSLEYCIEELIIKSKVTDNKMAEENQVTTEPQQVTTKNPKKVEAGKRLAEYNHRKREELKVQKSEVEPMLDSSQYYGIGVVLGVGVIGSLGYYIYQTKVNAIPNSPPQQPSHPHAPHPQTNKLQME